MGDVAAAKRNMKWVQMAVEDNRFDQLDGRIEKVEGDLEGLSDADKAPFLAELAEYRKAGQVAVAKEKAKRTEEAIARNISGADPSLGAERVKDMLARATEMLAAEDAQQYLSEDTKAALRAKISTARGDSVETQKIDAMDRIKGPLEALESRLASDPFKGADAPAARTTWQELTAWVTRVRGYMRALPEDDDARALAKKLDGIESSIAEHSGKRDRDASIAQLEQTYEQATSECLGWQEERITMGWDAFAEARGESFGIPLTFKALRALTAWVDNAFIAELKAEYQDDAAVIALNAQATAVVKEVTVKSAKAIERILDDAENAKAPTDRRELQKPDRFIREIEHGLAETAPMAGLRNRATALRQKWEDAAQKYEDEGKEIYRKLEAEAAADWPMIAQSIKAEEGFDPTQPDVWRNKTIRLSGVRNRSGWDFDSEYDFAMHINGVAVAGKYEMKIANAMRDMVRRTRNSIDDHKDWDVIAVVDGQGTIQQRVRREVWIEEKKEKITMETWEPFPCVTMRVIALHAGPVAVGPR